MQKLFSIIILSAGLQGATCVSLQLPAGFTTGIVMSSASPNFHHCFQKAVTSLAAAAAAFHTRAKNCTGDIDDEVSESLIRLTEAVEITNQNCVKDTPECGAGKLAQELAVMESCTFLMESSLNGELDFKVPLLECVWKEVREVIIQCSTAVQETLACQKDTIKTKLFKAKN